MAKNSLADEDSTLAFRPAAALLDALRRREISAVELLDYHLRRIERYDPALNSIVVKRFDQAHDAARRADQSRAQGAEAPLLGLPITIKESIDLAGTASTAGVASRVGHVAERDALTVRRLIDAGAVVLGKTNVCTWLADFQADNPVYGRTLSPWNPARTPGGSSGGSATLAAGLTALDLGSDLGGSIRVPAAFCGLWGHKPSAGLVPNSGHFPGSSLPNPTLVLAVQGPHARSAVDLELTLDVIAGPDLGMERGVQISLPAPRRSRLRDFRIGVLPRLSWIDVESAICAALDQLTAGLRKTGAVVEEARPEEFGDFRPYYAVMRSIMAATTSIGWPAERRKGVIDDKLRRNEEFHQADARGIGASASDFIQWHAQREMFRATWSRFFESWDVLLAPITFTTAFEHTRTPNADRRLSVNGRDQEFEWMSFYPSLATLAGLPTTVFPAGFDAQGLPIGLQAIGPYMDDRTPMAFARLLEQERGGFISPPAY